TSERHGWTCLDISTMATRPPRTNPFLLPWGAGRPYTTRSTVVSRSVVVIESSLEQCPGGRTLGTGILKHFGGGFLVRAGDALRVEQRDLDSQLGVVLLVGGLDGLLPLRAGDGRNDGQFGALVVVKPVGVRCQGFGD